MTDSKVILEKPWLSLKNERVDICENCQKETGKLKIEVKNVKEDDYTDTNRVRRHGNVAELSINVRSDSSKDKTITVYEGQRFEIDTYSVFVEKISAGVKSAPGLIGTALGGVTLKIKYN